MALDAVTMSLLAKELDEVLTDSRIDKIHQPSKDEVVFNMRNRGGSFRLLISARSGSARICTTRETFENPSTPPSFCMLMRKYLSGARFVKSSAVDGERIIILSFTATGEMGDIMNIDLVAELMGRYANIVLVNGEGKIIDAMKRVDADASAVRQLLPGLMYKLPPNRDTPKFISETDKVLDLLFTWDSPVDKALMKSTQGIGPVVAREAACLRKTGDIYATAIAEEERQKVRDSIYIIKEYYNNPVYTVVSDENGKPVEYSFMPLTQYRGLPVQQYDSLCRLLDNYYGEKDRAERLRQKGKDLHKTVQNLTDRTARRQAARREEMVESADNDRYRIYGELLTANLYKMHKGMTTVTVDNYYNGEEVNIPLDPKLAPNANAQKYYREYRKKQTAVKVLENLIQQGDIELEYLQSVVYNVNSATSEAELNAIRGELKEAGYLKSYRPKDKKQKPQDFIRYISSDGFLILVGRNNLQNDRLTMKTARGKDMWFHVKNAPGSHVVVMSEGKDIPLATQNEAAMLAVYHSSRKGGVRVEVDYTFVRNIRKTNDLKPGMVIYDTYETAYIAPDMAVIEKLTENRRAK